MLELGGKSPCIVDDTIDPVIAAKRIAWGKLLNCGQTCIAPDYVLVDEKIAAKFIKALGDSFVEMLGNASESKSYARIVSDRHFERLTNILKKQLQVSGSKLEFGGSSRKEDRFIEPTVVSLANGDVDENPMLQEELFGPFLPVITFSNLDQAIVVAKKICENPLSLYPFSNSNENIEKIFRKINAGHAVANDCIINAAVDDLPFGGVGGSGMGSYHGIDSFTTFTRKQARVVRMSSFDIQNITRYPNHCGDIDSWIYKLNKFVLMNPPPSNAYLFSHNIFRKLGGFHTVVNLVMLGLGILIAYLFFKIK